MLDHDGAGGQHRLASDGDLARPGETARSIRGVTLRNPKKIFAYTKTLPTSNGLVQLQDKIVVRFALTIYPYSFGHLLFFNNCSQTSESLVD